MTATIYSWPRGVLTAIWVSNMPLTNLIYGIAFLLLGLIAVVFSKHINRFALKRWQEAYPNIKLGEKVYFIGFFVLGIAFIIFGLALLLNIIEMK